MSKNLEKIPIFINLLNFESFKKSPSGNAFWPQKSLPKKPKEKSCLEKLQSNWNENRFLMVLLTFWSVWVWLCLAGLLESWPFWPLAWASFGWAERSNNKNELLLLNSRHNLHWWMMMKHMIIIKSQKAKQTNPFFTTTIYRKCHKTKKNSSLPKGTSTLTWNFPTKMKRKFKKK